MPAFLRTHRRRAGLTLEALATETGLTKSYLSKVERGLSTPSISVALKIARALDAEVGQLFSDEVDESSMTITRAATSPSSPGAPASSFYDPVAPSQVGKAMQPFVVHPAVEMGPRFLDHPGEEFVFVHVGEVEFEIPGRLVRLGAGDSVYFDASTPHRMRSVNSSGAMVLVVTYETPDDGSTSQNAGFANCGGAL